MFIYTEVTFKVYYQEPDVLAPDKKTQNSVTRNTLPFNKAAITRYLNAVPVAHQMVEMSLNLQFCRVFELQNRIQDLRLSNYTPIRNEKLSPAFVQIRVFVTRLCVNFSSAECFELFHGGVSALCGRELFSVV